MDIEVINEQNYPDTIFCYIKNFLNEDDINIYNNYLKSLPEFVDGGSRSQRWYHKDKKYFCPKWKERFKKWNSFEYDSNIINFQNNIIMKLKNYQVENWGIKLPQINSCLINRYKNGNDYIRAHRDTHLTFGKFPTIINISIGETRRLLFKKNLDDSAIEYNLESGSIFIMSGSSQELYTHEITKSDTINERFSLTFRQVL
tara:strand:+ start:978 stop:1580 length:603 start_codon:yes stop_codon:yes gene_type:complete